MINRTTKFTYISSVLISVLTLVASGCRSLPKSVTAHDAGAVAHPLSIAQGVTGATTARFSVVVEARAHPTYFVREVSRDAATERPLVPKRVRGPGSDVVVDQLGVDGLKLATAYELIVVRDGEVWDRRQFFALDPNKARARVAVISCMDDTMGAEARQMWPQVLAQDVDALLLIGDNVYADHVRAGPHWKNPIPADLWRRYVETRRSLPLYFAERLVPIVATWDDHDFAHDNADRTYPYREDSRQTFFAFFPQAEPAENFSRGPGVASWWRAFGVEWALTDDRYFRTPDKVDSPDQTHFGPEQERWLVDNLKSADRPVLLISGDQFFGGYHTFESYEGSHPRSFGLALEQWRAAVRAPLLFISGDRHLSEIIKVPEQALGFATFEITSSGIHSSVFADSFRRTPSPHQLVGVAGKLNYTILEFMRTEPGLLRLSAQAFAPGPTSLYQRTLTVKR